MNVFNLESVNYTDGYRVLAVNEHRFPTESTAPYPIVLERVDATELPLPPRTKKVAQYLLHHTDPSALGSQLDVLL